DKSCTVCEVGEHLLCTICTARSIKLFDECVLQPFIRLDLTIQYSSFPIQYLMREH
uniref:Uncharacterized protein n=1 Tax=Parascaris univalens TaxID=6257 RepID=A0A915CCT4_PARUN